MRPRGTVPVHIARFLYGSAEGLEEYTYARTRSSIRALLDLAPKEA